MSPADETVDPAVDALLVAAQPRAQARNTRARSSSRPSSARRRAIHARDMAKHHKLDHTGSDGSTVGDRVKRVGYVYVRVGENIAKGQKTVDQVMDIVDEKPRPPRQYPGRLHRDGSRPGRRRRRA